MAFSYGFFDAKDRDRVYTAENFTEYLSSLICNGILDTYGDCFAVTANNNLTVTIGTGKAWVNGHYFNNGEAHTLDLSSHVDGASNRYAAIAICCDTSERKCSLVVKTSDASVIPTFTDTESQTYLTFAAVYLPAGAGAIVSADIVDLRADESRCGYVKCILGKCGITDLLAKIDELEKRSDAIEGTINIGDHNAPLIVFSQAATGMVSPVAEFVKPLDGLVGVVASLEGLKLKEEKEESK